MSETKTCKICQTPFTSQYHLAKTCSPECSREWKMIAWREYQQTYRVQHAKPKPPSKTLPCWKCQKEFNWEYSPLVKGYPQRNKWSYWTEKSQDEGQYICDACLISFEDEHLNLNSINSVIKRKTLRYIVKYLKKKLGIKSWPLESRLEVDTFNCDKDYRCSNSRCWGEDRTGCGRKITVWSVIDPKNPESSYLLKEF
jgi:hypothetical protein